MYQKHGIFHRSMGLLEFRLCRKSAYELDLAIRTIKVVYILCYPVSF